MIQWSTITDNVALNFKALDPNVKIAYAEHEWDSESFEIGLEKLRQVVSNVF
jgi:hypothetical protein